MINTASPTHPHTVPTWDLPTRLCHGALVLLVVDAWVSHKFGDVLLRWHTWNGYAILTLLVFRVIWGFVGSSTARFADFIVGWRSLRHYLSGMSHGRMPHHLGHNPAGGWSVVVLLVLMILQGGSGLFASDEILASGPLRFLVGAEMSGKLTTWHSVGFRLLLGMIVLHLGGVFFHLFVGRDNLILPMLTGVKPADKVPSGVVARMQSPWLALPVLVGSALLVWVGIRVWTW
ncbi:MAG: cytochrome b/b6 domain-containing protein [Magnetococcales bacterium]|nr:cytochrome b/b6 domain-containing protein [Magnetococcales bacterium]